jgi:branched-chain amino acid transport system permease protein
LFGATILTIVVIVTLINSSYGRAIISVREDEVASELMASTHKYKVLAFVFGAMFAGWLALCTPILLLSNRRL